MRSRIATAVVALGLLLGLPALGHAATAGADAALSTEAAARATGVSAPEISAPGVVSASSDQFVSIQAVASDPDAGDLLTVAATGAPASLSLSGASGASPLTATLSGTLGAGDVGSYFIDWTVTSTGGGSATATTNLQVAQNADPVVTAPSSVSGAETVALTFAVSATDPDGDAITSLTASNLPGGATFTPNALLTGGLFAWTPSLGSQGSYTVTFTAASGSPVRSSSATTVVNIGARDRAPVISGAPGTVNAVTSVQIALNPTVSDPDGDAINSFVCRGTQNTALPPGAAFTTNPTNTVGAFRWTPTPAQAGTVSIDFIAASGALNLTTTVVTKIIVKVDRAPVVTAPATASGAENSPIGFNVSASDPDATPIASLTASPLPAGATFTANANNTAGTFAWTPTYSQSGTYPIVFAASNALVGSATTTISVANVDRAPVVSAPATVTVAEGSTLTVPIGATDPDGDAIGSMAASGLPGGATFTSDPSTGTGFLAWTPGYGQAGIYSVAFTASNALTGTASTTITVANVDRAPIVTAPTAVTGTEGSPISFPVSAADPDGEAIASLGIQNAPPGATFTVSPDNALGAFDWTPGYADAGAYTVTFRAANAQATTVVTTITVGNANRAPLAVDGGPYTGVAGSPVSFNGTSSSDPDGDALAYSWNFGDGGTASGATPTHTYAAGGTYSVTLTVTDNGSPALSDNSITTANITSVYAARLFTTGGNKAIRLGSGKPEWCLQLEAAGNAFALSEVSIPEVRLHYGTDEIQAIGGKNLFSGDTDGNAIPELSLCFAKGDLRRLLASLPSGKQTVALQLTGRLNGGALFSGSITVEVVGSGGSLAASVSPNPLNPEATLSLRTTRAGAIRVRLYDAAGRFVRMLEDVSNSEAGYHDVRIDGRDASGRRLATGVYFYRAETADGVVGGRFTILK